MWHLVQISNANLTDSTGMRAWTDLRSNTECNADAGEFYQKESSRSVNGIDACKKSCEYDSECKSITFFANSKWCSHFTTNCANTKSTINAISMRLGTAGQ